MNIWALFSIDNNYDQPPNNLVAWWSEKPTLEVLAKTLNTTFPHRNDKVTLFIVKVWDGESIEDENGTEYRLEYIKEGYVE